MDEDVIVFNDLIHLDPVESSSPIFNSIVVKLVTLLGKKREKFVKSNSKALQKPGIDFADD